MITRCPSCTAEVAEDALSCSSCHWDFFARKKISPGDATLAASTPELQSALKTADTSSPPIAEKPALEAPPTSSLIPAQKTQMKMPQLPPLEIEPGEKFPEPAPASKPSIPELKPTELPEVNRAPAKPSEPKPVPIPDRMPFRKQSPEAEPPSKAFGPLRRKPIGLWVMAGGVVVLGILIFFFFNSEEISRPAPPAEDLFLKAEPPHLEPAPLPPVAAASTGLDNPKPDRGSAPEAPATVTPVAVVAPVDQAPAFAITAAEPESKATPLWIFEGRVYGLVSLEAVYGASLVFQDGEGKSKGTASTGDDGRYRIILPALPGGYQLALAHPDFMDKYLDEIAPPWSKAPKPQRIKASLAVAGQNQPWIGSASQTTRRDFVMMPKSAAQLP